MIPLEPLLGPLPFLLLWETFEDVLAVLDLLVESAAAMAAACCACKISKFMRCSGCSPP